MPRAFSDSERAFLKKRLMEEAQSCLTRYGMRKTTVDELVKRVHIPKGTFYLLYPSKEMLFFEVFRTLHDQMKTEFLQWIGEMKGDINAESMTELLLCLYKQADATFLYSFIASGELELLVRSLPPEVAAAHAKEDDFSMEQLLSLLPGVQAERNVRLFSAVLRAVFCTMLHRREIGEDLMDDVIRIMLRGVVKQLFEGETL
jgi:AcrR family transcriptional regulator